MNKRPALFIAAVAAAVAVLAFAFFQRDSGPSCAYTSERAVLPDFSGVIEKVMPSLVKIENEGLAGHPDFIGMEGNSNRGGGGGGEMGGGGGEMGKGEIEIAQTREGTGFFVDKSGLILTNYHVIEGAQVLRVETRDKRRFTAKVIGADPLSDVAVIKIKPDFNVIPVEMGDSSRLKMGQWVVALGNPLGLEFFSSAGIISGFGPPGPNYIGFFDFIQADLNIEPGNSGGPMVNYKGQVIGINNAYLGPGTMIGFAIPINRAKEVMDQLIKNGKISRGYLGLIGQDLTEGLADRLGLKQVTGSLVSEVLDGSPAQAGGIQPKDVVLEFDGRKVDDDRTFQERIYGSPAGKKVDILVLRDGSRIHLPVILGELEAHSLATERVAIQCGITLQPIPEQIAARLGLKENKGLLVLKVVPGCPAFEGGLRFGDVVRKIEGVDINTVSDFYREYSRMRRGRNILVEVIRDGRPYYVTIQQEG
ncbi:MAG: trypsin-like peptidase domain-containing protein [Nitrospirota bacterium]